MNHRIVEYCPICNGGTYEFRVEHYDRKIDKITYTWEKQEDAHNCIKELCERIKTLEQRIHFLEPSE